MKPKPFASLNHFTVPVVMLFLRYICAAVRGGCLSSNDLRRLPYAVDPLPTLTIYKGSNFGAQRLLNVRLRRALTSRAVGLTLPELPRRARGSGDVSRRPLRTWWLMRDCAQP